MPPPPPPPPPRTFWDPLVGDALPGLPPWDVLEALDAFARGAWEVLSGSAQGLSTDKHGTLRNRPEKVLKSCHMPRTTETFDIYLHICI